MIKKIKFTDKTKQSIIAKQKTLGFRLVEEQRYEDGNWLLFTDEEYIKPEPIRDVYLELDQLGARLDKLESKGAMIA